MTAFHRRLGLALALFAGLAASAAAQEDQAARRFGDDLFIAGEDVRVVESGLEDVFAAGQTVTVSGNVDESVHAAGARVQVTGSTGRDVYAAARAVELRGAVTGDAVAFGQRVQLTGSATQDVLFAGQTIEIAGPVGGDATLMAETVEIAAPISGSVQIRAGEIRFGPAARIDGTLEYWSPNPVTIPPGVIAPERVTGVRTEAHERREERAAFDRGVAFGIGVIVMLVLAAIFSALAPRRLEQAHAGAVERPWLNLLLGLVAGSAIFGSILVLAVSIIGIPLIPVVILLAPLALLIGYLTAAFSVGRLSLGLAKVRLGDGWTGAFAAMATGVVLLAVIRLIPIFGWVVLVLAILVGLGAWFAYFLRPRPAATM